MCLKPLLRTPLPTTSSSSSCCTSKSHFHGVQQRQSARKRASEYLSSPPTRARVHTDTDTDTDTRADRGEEMMEARYTSVMRSTRSGNYYNVPIAPEVLKQAELSPELSTFGAYDDPHGTSAAAAVAAAWGTTHMRRLPTMRRRQDLNATLSRASQTAGRAEDAQTPQVAFALDLNQLVASLTKDSALDTTSPGSSFASAKSPSAGEPQPEPMSLDDSRIQILPVESPVVAPRQRTRRDALAGDEPPRAHGTDNSLIAYSLNKRKQKRLAARAMHAASSNGPNFEYVVAETGKEYQPQYVPRYVPQYQAAGPTPATPSSSSSSSTTRQRELSVDQESYAF